MNLLTILLTISCNKNCPYCVIEKWKKPLDYIFEEPPEHYKVLEGYGYPMPLKANSIENKYLLPWLKRHINPDEWYIELTGGEPGLYKEIDTLIPELNKMGYKGIIRTNGTLPIPKSDNFKLIAAWHDNFDNPPAFYDLLLVMNNNFHEWKKRIHYCKENGIPYASVELNVGQQYICNITIDNWAYINSVGQLTGCPKKPVDESKNIFNMSEPVLLENVKECPGNCINVSGFEEVYKKAGERGNLHKNTH